MDENCRNDTSLSQGRTEYWFVYRVTRLMDRSVGPLGGPGWFSRYSDSLRAGRSGDRIPVVARFSAPVQTGPGTHPASYTMGTGSFPGGKVAGAWRCQPTPSSNEVKERVGLYLYSSFGPLWPVLEWNLLSSTGLLENSVRDGVTCENLPRYLTYLMIVRSLKLVIHLKKIMLKVSVPSLHRIGCLYMN